MKKTHTHHIIPRYMGGTDEPSNLVELTVEEHAQAHKELYEKYGNIQDKIAWFCLSGKSKEVEELRKQLARDKFQEFLNDPERVAEWKSKISNTLTGRPLSEEHKQKITNGVRKAYAEGRINPKPIDKEILSANWHKNREKLRLGRINSEKWNSYHKCPEYREKKRQLMLGRENTWGDKVSASKRDKKTKSTIEVIVNGIKFNSIASAARHFDVPTQKLRKLYVKQGKVITF